MGGAQLAGAENAFAAGLFEPLPARYDALADLLSFAQNRRWRMEVVSHTAEARPRTVLDVATGTAGVAIEIARATQAEIVGVDLSEPMLARGRERVRAAGLDGRISLRPARAEALPFPDASFDAVSFAYLLRYVADPAATMRELARVLRPGGAIAGLDFFVPPSRGWRWAWRVYTRAGLPVAGLVTGGPAWWRVGTFLGPNIEDFYARWPLSAIEAAWRDAGISDVRAQPMSLGGGVVMWGRRL
ncbi:MAG TPA: class I SAM-dependent methyltransferase [Candidatus Dormibacteraeota bacterium]|nr:class I SAM-dependent methyltransferase [Candidatus Dormibacteraeota bacterium]